MEKGVFETDPTTINTTVITSVLGLYIFFRSFVSIIPSVNFIKGKFRFVAGLFLKIAIFSSVVYEITIYLLSTKFKINRIELELSKNFQEHHQISYGGFTVDLAFLMTTSLKITEIMFMSSIFLCISLMAPSPELTYFFNLNVSIISFSRLWSIFRIPTIYYSSKLNLIMDEKAALFLKLLFCGIEVCIASSFAFILGFKNNTLKNLHTDSFFFSSCLMSYGFLKYFINIIDFPFKLNSEIVKLIFSVQFVLLNAIYLQITSLIFPRKSLLQPQKIPSTVNHPNERYSTDVALLETVVEFDEMNPIYQIK